MKELDIETDIEFLVTAYLWMMLLVYAMLQEVAVL
jgi:hypothetical protein